ncbi:MAG: hypothetical protein ACLQVI_02055 [Polyangiaceae bacterium]
MKWLIRSVLAALVVWALAFALARVTWSEGGLVYLSLAPVNEDSKSPSEDERATLTLTYEPTRAIFLVTEWLDFAHPYIVPTIERVRTVERREGAFKFVNVPTFLTSIAGYRLTRATIAFGPVTKWGPHDDPCKRQFEVFSYIALNEEMRHGQAVSVDEARSEWFASGREVSGVTRSLEVVDHELRVVLHCSERGPTELPAGIHGVHFVVDYSRVSQVALVASQQRPEWKAVPPLGYCDAAMGAWVSGSDLREGGGVGSFGHLLLQSPRTRIQLEGAVAFLANGDDGPSSGVALAGVVVTEEKVSQLAIPVATGAMSRAQWQLVLDAEDSSKAVDASLDLLSPNRRGAKVEVTLRTGGADGIARVLFVGVAAPKDSRVGFDTMSVRISDDASVLVSRMVQYTVALESGTASEPPGDAAAPLRGVWAQDQRNMTEKKREEAFERIHKMFE